MTVTRNRDGKCTRLKQELSDENDKKIVEQFACGNYHYTAKLLWDNTIIRDLVLQIMLKNIQADCSNLCSRKNPSVLRKISSSNIVGFKDSYFDSELKERSPILYSVLKEEVTSTKARNRAMAKIRRTTFPPCAWQPRYCYGNDAVRCPLLHTTCR